MALVGTIRAFGLRDIKLTPISGVGQVDLPHAMTLTVKERVISGEMHGDDAVQAIVAFSDAVEWELEAGGISLEAYVLMTGRSVALTGTGSSEVNTVSVNAGDVYPYFKIYGQSMGDGTDDIHVKLNKAKLTAAIEGQFKDGEFYVTKCSGVAIDPGATPTMEIVQNETATTLPTS
jgi:hypothetical protein